MLGGGTGTPKVTLAGVGAQVTTRAWPPARTPTWGTSSSALPTAGPPATCERVLPARGGECKSFFAGSEHYTMADCCAVYVIRAPLHRTSHAANARGWVASSLPAFKGQATVELEECHRVSTHGGAAGTYHANCDDKGPTLTVVRSEDGHLFGVVAANSRGSLDGQPHCHHG